MTSTLASLGSTHTLAFLWCLLLIRFSDPELRSTDQSSDSDSGYNMDNNNLGHPTHVKQPVEREDGEVYESQALKKLRKTKKNNKSHLRTRVSRTVQSQEHAAKLQEQKRQADTLEKARDQLKLPHSNVPVRRQGPTHPQHEAQHGINCQTPYLPWSSMGTAMVTKVKSTLQVVMDCGENMYPIKNNAATQLPSAPAHGSHGNHHHLSLKPHRKMFAVGWHLTQDLGKSVGTYAPKKKDAESMEMYMANHAKLPKVAALYQHGLSTLFPGGADMMQTVADCDGVLSLSDGVLPEWPFANSLTATSGKRRRFPRVTGALWKMSTSIS
ncbi:hypothetical protein FB451DRAFT_1179379 [Mycena latifolia]|nr:hypothetical protein FB451DRAFT_1179379 [Mycena latifolia]